MAWFTAGDINALLGPSATAIRTKVAPTTASFVDAEGRARRKVRAAYQMAGYTTSDTTATALQKDLAMAQWVLERYGVARGLAVPPSIADLINMLNLVRSGELPDPDATPSTRDGIGGSEFTDSSQTSASTAARPARLDRSELNRW